MYRTRKTIDNTTTLTTQSKAFYLINLDLKKRHEAALPPREAYLNKPQGTDVILFNEKRPWKSIRRIFFDGEYTQYELDLLRKFKQLINEYTKSKEIAFPEAWCDEDNLRYIYSTNCKLDKSLSDMIDHFKWRKATFPLKITNKIIEILDLGFVYILGRDYQFRPIIVCQASVYVKHQDAYTYEEWLHSTLFLTQYMSTYLLIPGKVENSIMITYVKNVHVLSLPQSMKKVIGIMSDQYRSRLHLNFIVGMSQALRFLFKIICKFLDETTVQKMMIVDHINDGKLSRQISSENLEEKFGGKVPNINIGTDTLFPPLMPCSKIKDIENDIKKESPRKIKEGYTNQSNHLLPMYNSSPDDSHRKISRQSVIQFHIDNKKDAEELLRVSKVVNELDSLEINNQFNPADDFIKYKSPRQLTSYTSQFNKRKKLLNNKNTFLTEGVKPSKIININS